MRRTRSGMGKGKEQNFHRIHCPNTLPPHLLDLSQEVHPSMPWSPETQDMQASGASRASGKHPRESLGAVVANLGNVLDRL